MSFFITLKKWLISQAVLVCLGLICLAASWSLLTPQFFRVHDYTHAARISELSRALADGHFPVRWSQNLGYGFGMPLFNYYAPLPYYIGGLIYSLGFDVVIAIKLLFVIATVLTAWGSYKLGQEWFGTWGGIVTAAAVTLAPYRAVNLFVRGAVSEAWAIAFLPVILWAMSGVIKGQKSAWGWLVAGLTGLFLSHNITTLLFLPLSVIVAILYIATQYWFSAKEKSLQQSWRALISVALAYLAGIGLASFYLLPAFLEKDLTKFKDTILSGYFDYHLHFLYIRQFFWPNWKYGGSGWGPTDDISFFLGYGQLLAVGLVVVLLGQQLWQGFKHKSLQLPQLRVVILSLIALGLTGVALVMSLQKTLPIWELLPILAFAQFPWRWLSVAVVGLGLVSGALAALLPNKWWRGLVLLGLFLIVAVGNAQYFRPEKYLEAANGYYYTEPKLIQGGMSDVLPDYIPQQMAKELHAPANLWLNPELTEKEITVVVNRTQEKLLQVTVAEPVQLELAVADFPTWVVELDGEIASKTVGKLGNVQIAVPAGSHTVGLIWHETVIETIGDALTLITLFLLIGWVFYQKSKHD
jgi:hypothetical protein